MVLAYILISTEAGEMKNVLGELRELNRIREAHMVTGPYDIITIAEADSMGQITHILMNEIRKISGLLGSVTCVQIEE